MEKSTQSWLFETVLAHTFLSRMSPQAPSLLELLQETKPMSAKVRIVHLAKKLEAQLTLKSASLQFATTLSNFLENFKTNPSKVTSFLSISQRYLQKAEHFEIVRATIQHSIITSLKNSSGLLKKYIQSLHSEDLEKAVENIIDQSILDAVIAVFEEVPPTLMNEEDPDYGIDQLLDQADEIGIQSFLETLFDKIYTHTKDYAKSLEPEKQEPVSQEGGLKELTQDFSSTIKYHGRKNWINNDIIQNLIDKGVPEELASIVAYGCSYITYQVASKEGQNGELFHRALVSYFEQKLLKLKQMGLSFEDAEFHAYIDLELKQTHALVALASKIKTDAYNAWTALPSSQSKHAVFLNAFLLPNIFFWQRLPRGLVDYMVSSNIIERSQVRELIAVLGRDSLLDAYSLICIGFSSSINCFEEAHEFIKSQFNIEGDIRHEFLINPSSGEAEVTQEAIYIWNKLQEA